MGSWYETCGLTQLPIKEGEEVVVIFIQKHTHILQSYWSALSNPTDLYTPISLPEAGIYNDYGRVKGNPMLNGKIERVQAREDAENQAPVGYVMYLKEAYDKVLDEIKSRDTYVEQLKEDMKKVVDAKAALLVETDKTARIQKEFRFYDEIQNGELNRILRFFGSYNRNFRPILDQAAEKNDAVMQDKMIDLYLFEMALELMRKAWLPSCGKGSQYQEYYLPALLGEFTQQKKQQAIDDYLEENIWHEEDGDIIQITKDKKFWF